MQLRALAPRQLEARYVLSLALMYRDGDFSRFEVGKRGSEIGGLAIMLFSQHEQCPPAELFTLGNSYGDDLTLRASAIAHALLANDNAALARAIDEAEAHQIIVHAARMRIVLARRSADSLLARARPLLERLDDRLFLRKLRAVEALLQMQQD